MQLLHKIKILMFRATLIMQLSAQFKKVLLNLKQYRNNLFFDIFIKGLIFGTILILYPMNSQGLKSHASYVICKNHHNVRTIRVEVENNDSPTCEAIYTKNGLDKKIGEGINTSSCQRFANNVKGNLEAANWRCKDVSDKVQVSISTGQEN